MRSIENSDKIRQASAGTMAICVRVYGSQCCAIRATGRTVADATHDYSCDCRVSDFRQRLFPRLLCGGTIGPPLVSMLIATLFPPGLERFNIAVYIPL